MDLRRDFDVSGYSSEEDVELASASDSLLVAASRAAQDSSWPAPVRAASIARDAGWGVVRWLDGERETPAVRRKRRTWAVGALCFGFALVLVQGATILHMVFGFRGDECAAAPRGAKARWRGPLDLYARNATSRALGETSDAAGKARTGKSKKKAPSLRNGTLAKAAPAAAKKQRVLRQSDLVFWGTHNSYHRAPRTSRFPFWNGFIPQWQYSHPRLAAQLDAGARHLELDVHVDSANRKALVYHVQSLDSRTRCYCLRDCARSLLDWSARRGGDHGLVIVLLEVKGTKSYVEDVASHFRGLGDDRYSESRDALAVIDDTIFDVFSRRQGALVTPSDVADGYASCNAAVRARGWPPERALRGKFAFALLDSSDDAQLTRAYDDPGKQQDARRAPNAMFTMAGAVSTSESSRAAIFKYDNPNNPDHFASIQAAVKAGFLVRTRANTVKFVDNYDRFARAKASGAQLVSFEADAHSNWLRFVGKPHSLCVCDDLALAGSDRRCDADRPPCA